MRGCSYSTLLKFTTGIMALPSPLQASRRTVRSPLLLRSSLQRKIPRCTSSFDCNSVNDCLAAVSHDGPVEPDRMRCCLVKKLLTCFVAFPLRSLFVAWLPVSIYTVHRSSCKWLHRTLGLGITKMSNVHVVTPPAVANRTPQLAVNGGYIGSASRPPLVSYERWNTR